ncbi:hypothetical protein ACROYT_G017561, partial [Oculina patagonica]
VMCFSLSLVFVVGPQVVLSTPVNKTTADGKIFITGDHNEVVVSTAQETKIALAEIKRKLHSLSAKDEGLARKLQVVDERILPQNETRGKLDAMNETIKNIEKKVDFMNKTNAALSAKVQAMSQRLTTLERQGMYIVLLP